MALDCCAAEWRYKDREPSSTALQDVDAGRLSPSEFMMLEVECIEPARGRTCTS